MLVVIFILTLYYWFNYTVDKELGKLATEPDLEYEQDFSPAIYFENFNDAEAYLDGLGYQLRPASKIIH